MTEIAISADIDTSLKSTSATTNYGTATSIYVGENNTNTDKWRGLVKFDFSGIPSNAIVQTAVMKLTVSQDYSSNARDYRVFRQKRAWIESQATWNIYSTGNNWQTAGGFGSDDCEQTDIGSVSLSATEAVNSNIYITLDASKIQEMISGAFSNNGFEIKADTETNDLYGFHSSEASTSSYRPKITINYTLPNGNFFAFF